MNRTNQNAAMLVRRVRALGSKFAADADMLEDYLQCAGESRFVIANAGTTNTGKSTLFNAILGKEEAFRTADVRETTVCRDIAWGPCMALVDTPGCGSCSAADDREAAKAYRRADLVLFVHNLAAGGLKRDEMDVLEAVRRYMGEKDFKERTMMVGTRLDCCSAEAATVNRQECEAQIQAEMGVKLKFFAVSPKRHFRGLGMVAAGEKAKAGVLLASAGMESLVNAIRAISKKDGRRGLNRFDGLRKKIRDLVLQARTACARDEAAVRKAQRDAQAEMEPIEAEIRSLRSA